MNFLFQTPRLIHSLALAIAPQFRIRELTLLAAAFSQLGDTFATIAAERQLREESSESEGNPSSKSEPEKESESKESCI